MIETNNRQLGASATACGGAKVYVSVKAKFTGEGKVIPLCVIWEDGREFSVDRVLDCRTAPAMKAGGLSARYTVRVRGRETYLFLEGGRRWFVERK